MGKVYTGGTFDLFHSGHVNFLRQCKKIAGDDPVVVALNSDEFISRFKGKPPVYSYDERYELLAGCKYVDKVIENWGEEDSKKTILGESPEFIVIGSDWAKKDYYAQMNFSQEWLDTLDIVLIYVPYTQGISTTEIKERICHDSNNRSYSNKI